MELEECRKEIDRLDRELTRLLEQRMDVVAQVAQFKVRHHMDVYDPKRELIVLDKIASLAENKDLVPHLKKIYQCIMDASKDYERKNMGR